VADLKLTIGGSDFTPALSSEPTIQDQLNAVCRSLTFSVQQPGKPQQLTGRDVELYYNGVRWFKGQVRRQTAAANGQIDFLVYDPLYLWGKHADDWYFKTQTATQIFNTMAGKCGTTVASLANTLAVFSYLYYPGAQPEAIALDVLARTRNANGRKYWFRYDPVKDGLTLFEKTIPAKLWAFQLGVNLLSASKTDSIEELCASVKLVHRESGKVVTKTNSTAQGLYGLSQHFEEVNSDTENLETKAAALLADLSKVAVTMNVSGVNPDAAMGQFFSGDPIYVEEPNTGMVGGYYIKDVTHTIRAKNLVTMEFDLQQTPELPAIQFEDADTKK